MLSLRPRCQVPVLAGSLAVAVGMGVFLSPPANVNAFGTLGRAEAATTPVPPAPAGMSFPGVAGVHLLDRKSGGSGKSVAGREDLGCRRIIKKKKQTCTKSIKPTACLT